MSYHRVLELEEHRSILMEKFENKMKKNTKVES